MLRIALVGAFLAIPAWQGRDARAIVRAVEARYHRAKTLEAVFLERYSEGQQGIRVESGKVFFSRPGRMRWEYETPESKLFLVDGRNVWFYIPADRTASRAKIKESSDWRTPLALLVGKIRLARLCGAVELVAGTGGGEPEARPAVAGNVVLRCSPRKGVGGDASEQFREILFEADPAYRLVRVLIRDPGNIETEFRFADWKENVPLPESKFHFQPPLGVAVVDEAALAGEMR